MKLKGKLVKEHKWNLFNIFHVECTILDKPKIFDNYYITVELFGKVFRWNVSTKWLKRGRRP